MIKCVHEECRWPECEMTCGLVPEEEFYPVGASAEEGLIYHLQGRIAELKARIEEYERLFNEIYHSSEKIHSWCEDAFYEATKERDGSEEK